MKVNPKNNSMTDAQIKSSLYYHILDIAFSETEKFKLRSWIIEFIRTTFTYWQIDNCPVVLNGDANYCFIFELPVDTLDMRCLIKIDSLEKFSVEFFHLREGREGRGDFILRHETHPEYGGNFLLPYQFLPAQLSWVKQQFNDDQLSTVIDYMFMHPYVHTHIKGPIKPKNNIRLGGSITNALLYLYHLRYQLCPAAIRRSKDQQERDRLIKLFKQAMAKGQAKILATELMAVP